MPLHPACPLAKIIAFGERIDVNTAGVARWQTLRRPHRAKVQVLQHGLHGNKSRRNWVQPR